MIIFCKAFQCGFRGVSLGWTFQCDFQCHIDSLYTNRSLLWLDNMVINSEDLACYE